MAARRKKPEASAHFAHQVEPIDALVPYDRNARTHSEEQIEQLAESIRAFGFTNPLLIDEDRNVIAGHGRLEAAKAAGLVDVAVERWQSQTGGTAVLDGDGRSFAEVAAERLAVVAEVAEEAVT